LTHEELLDISERLGRLEVAVAGLDAQLEALERYVGRPRA
jgi:hypothetical protein